MPRHKFNLVGNTFNYDDAPRCSVWGKESEHIEWVEEGGKTVGAGVVTKIIK